jgi:hypothetical protein
MGKTLTPIEIDAELNVARARTKAAKASGRRAASARYDARAHRLMLTLTSNVVVGIPVDRIRYLAKATPTQLKHVTVTPTGSGVSWEELDVDLTIEGLLAEALGRGRLRGR